MTPPLRLYDCHSKEQQRLWVKRALEAGQTLSDVGLWLGGVDRPALMMRRLRKEGMRIEKCRKGIFDAAGEFHKDLAWRLEKYTVPSE